MTQDAQSALRRTMETYSRITRFCLVCNYVTRIIDPVASRCSKFRFKSLDQGDAVARIRDIARLEGVMFGGDGVAEQIVLVAEGDLRRAITYLQSAARLVGAEATGIVKEGDDDGMELDSDTPAVTAAATTTRGAVTTAIISEIAGTIPTSTINTLIDAIVIPASAASKSKSIKPTAPSTFDLIASTVKTMVADGWSAGQAVGQMYARIMFDDMIESRKRNLCAAVFSEVDKRLVDGADEELVLLDLACRVSGVLGPR